MLGTGQDQRCWWAPGRLGGDGGHWAGSAVVLGTGQAQRRCRMVGKGAGRSENPSVARNPVTLLVPPPGIPWPHSPRLGASVPCNYRPSVVLAKCIYNTKTEFHFSTFKFRGIFNNARERSLLNLEGQKDPFS